MKKKVVIVSGGMDSTTLLYDVVKEHGNENVIAITFYYGQKHNKEIDCARSNCINLKVEFKLIDLSKFMSSYKSALIQADSAIPHIKNVAGDPQPVTYVPYRNQLFLTIGCGVAESLDADAVYYGAQMHDLYGYWDTTKEFLDRFNSLIKLNRKSGIQIHAPYVDFSKMDIFKRGKELGVDYGNTWTCYKGGDKACGTCPTCSERLKAFKDAGEVDPIPYETKVKLQGVN